MRTEKTVVGKGNGDIEFIANIFKTVHGWEVYVPNDRCDAFDGVAGFTTLQEILDYLRGRLKCQKTKKN